ncbi:cell wall / vacuolar inhibitor of fructosidase 2-like [Eucalyptus grandis]|uniref:cell wall / vacuolar inhibitor of fructosidase 2-like n=1 Tax=Eucalyptus grandis TaxID=71139 RepID=UPI00192E941E|nr:cell wall / vacuolar inhibitor of fructosidase 2-like [Eucalyptus grandis]
MATSHALLLFCNLAFGLLALSVVVESSVVPPDYAEVDHVCSRTAPYYDKFCKDVLESDPRAPGADALTLAYVAFGLAHRNASGTRDQITSLLSNSTGLVRQHLERCRGDYATALANIQEALNDLDSKTYGRLTYFSASLLDRAKDCESAFKGTKSPLTDNNEDLKGFSVIGVSIAEELIV